MNFLRINQGERPHTEAARRVSAVPAVPKIVTARPRFTCLVRFAEEHNTNQKHHNQGAYAMLLLEVSCVTMAIRVVPIKDAPLPQMS